MKKDKFQPIVMPCTKEQYDSLIPILEQNEISIARNNDNCPYSKRITTYFAKLNNFVSRTYMPDAIFETDRPEVKIYKRFNRKIFLKSLGIIEEPEFVLPEKWFVTYSNFEEFDIINKHFKKDWGYIEGVNKNGYFSGADKQGNNWVSSGDTNKYSKKLLVRNGYTEITFNQFQKHVLEQGVSLLESQSVTNKQTKMKSTVNEIKQSEPTIKKGLLVVTQERVGIVTKYISDNNFDVTILHPSGHHGLIVTNLNYANIRIFKGKLTLEQ